MNIAFICSQSGLVSFQIEGVMEVFKDKGITELYIADSPGDDMAVNHALENKCFVYTIFPVDNPKKRMFIADKEKQTAHLIQQTPYLSRELFGTPVQIKWMPIEPSFERYKRMIDQASFVVACPKEHRFSVKSQTWKVIKYVWKTKKDLVIIPPVDRTDTST